MSSIGDRVQALQAQPKSELKATLAEELGTAYSGQITNSLRNDFMKACYEQIGTDDSPFDRVQAHDNYSSSWSRKKQLATALRMALTERVGHPEHQGITSLDRQVLAELIVAIRHSNTDDDSAGDSAATSINAPERDSLPEPRFDDRLPADTFRDYELYDWIVDHRSPDDGEHGVYVLDCTPPVGGEEDFRVESFRAEVHEKAESGHSLSKLERAAAAVNNAERLYYVGYAGDVPKRIREHVTGADAGGAKFTNLFEPQALVDVTWFRTEHEARQYERRRATELTVPGESFGYAE